MPWCPKCVSEYRPEIGNCPDCGAALVDELPGLSCEQLTPRQREMLLTAVQSFVAACLTIGLIIGLSLLSTWFRQYGYFCWDLVFMGCAAPIAGTFGFLSGKFRKSQPRLSAVAIGWSIPWLVLCILAVNASYGGSWTSAIHRGFLPQLLWWSAYHTTAALAGIIGTLIGVRWKQTHDWLRMAAFYITLVALGYFWTHIFNITLVAHD